MPAAWQALEHIDLEIRRGEIFALLGPQRRRQDDADQHRLRHRQRQQRQRDGRRPRHRARLPRRARVIGLVPQELTTDAFETVLATVTFSRGLFGKPPTRRTSRGCCVAVAVGQADSKIMTLSAA
jgi:ABC-2 type transport system ATP-binding protein